MDKPNFTSHCIYREQCYGYEFNRCHSASYQQNCSQLNSFLRKNSPEEREHIDYAEDMGLLRCIKK